MIDRPERPEPRFPSSIEPEVRSVIKEMVQQEQKRVENENGVLTGLAGGGNGGDILFHEVCAELEIKTKLFLALPRDQFLAESVAFAGPVWVDRFNQLYRLLPRKVLSQAQAQPNRLKNKKADNIWDRYNLWLLNQALKNGRLYMRLMALWDGKDDNGPGGTAHMVREAKARAARTIILPITEILNNKATNRL